MKTFKSKAGKSASNILKSNPAAAKEYIRNSFEVDKVNTSSSLELSLFVVLSISLTRRFAKCLLYADRLRTSECWTSKNVNDELAKTVQRRWRKSVHILQDSHHFGDAELQG